jgi:hypothetical protein
MDYAIRADGDRVPQADPFIPVRRVASITAEASLSRRLVEESPSLRGNTRSLMRAPDFQTAHMRVEVRRLDDLGAHRAGLRPPRAPDLSVARSGPA